MSAGDLDISSGGIVAVDTASLRDAAAALRVIVADCDGIHDALQRARMALSASEVPVSLPIRAAEGAATAALGLAESVDRMASIYELAEIDAALRLAGAGGAEATAELIARRRVLLRSHPDLFDALLFESARWRGEHARGLSDQYSGPVAEALLPLAAGLIAYLNRGPVPRGTTMTGSAARVSVERITSAPAAAPASVAQIVDRIPHGGAARVRVERYTMPGGGVRFAAYVSGTVLNEREDEAWSMASNLDMYGGVEGASAKAVTAALADAGAQPGDEVGLFGYSQGAGLASYLALSGEYDVPVLVTIGSPVQADVGEGTLSVALRHTDDPVSALANGGFAHRVGAEGSFIASREVPGVADAFAPHDLGAYRETAALVDASADPRVDELRTRLAAFAEATSVESFEYSAARE